MYEDMSFTLGLLSNDNKGETSSVLRSFSLHSFLTLQQQTWHPQPSPVALLLMTASCLRSHGRQHGHHTFCLKPFAPQGLQDSTGKRRSFQEVPSFSASHHIQTPPKSLKKQKQQHNLNCLFHFYCIIPKSFPLLSALYAIICQTVH